MLFNCTRVIVIAMPVCLNKVFYPPKQKSQGIQGEKETGLEKEQRHCVTNRTRKQDDSVHPVHLSSSWSIITCWWINEQKKHYMVKRCMYGEKNVERCFGVRVCVLVPLGLRALGRHRTALSLQSEAKWKWWSGRGWEQQIEGFKRVLVPETTPCCLTPSAAAFVCPLSAHILTFCFPAAQASLF